MSFKIKRRDVSEDKNMSDGDSVTITFHKSTAYSARLAIHMRLSELQDSMDRHVGQVPLCREELGNLKMAMSLFDNVLDG